MTEYFTNLMIYISIKIILHREWERKSNQGGAAARAREMTNLRYIHDANVMQDGDVVHINGGHERLIPLAL
jgi:hypothetical protein